ncbi:Uu.00g010700.m01.CDS01 [Anthostomella pinea]|uniref:Uu.00g010700.m01.CDS01 n=1 Tax=Anthostomella pinea TaxID=933095 RepID=A0AAI8YQ55_9PEZI|nr:Uu.00g010700.m01.CDS01 [Anthostomella pinea]
MIEAYHIEQERHRIAGSDAATIIRWLASVSRRQTSDQRDRIYGIIGLFPSNLGLIPDYSAGLAEVYEKGTVGFFKHLHSPAALVMAGLQNREAFKAPSWVPHFGRWGFSPNEAKACDGGLYPPQKRSFVYNQPGRLTLYAAFIDTISWAGSCFDWRFWDAAIGPSETFWRRLLSTTVSDTTDATAMPMLDAWLYADDLDVPSQWMSELSTQVTAKHGLGAVPYHSPLPGDIVAVIAKVPQPVILRPVAHAGVNAYQLVRVCSYCEGIMYGEAVREAALARNGNETNRDGVFQEIVLV